MGQQNLTTTKQNTLTGTAQNALNGAINNTVGVAGGPNIYQQAGAAPVAGINTTQYGAIQGLQGVGQYQPQQVQPGNATQFAGGTGQGGLSLNGANLSGYTNPYTQSVVNATQNQFNQSNATQQQQLQGNAALSGAFGGDRATVAQAQLAGQQQMAQAPVIAGLNSAGYTQAQNTAESDLTRQLQGGTAQAQLGLQAGQGNQFAGLQGANVNLAGNAAALQGGTLQQQTQQAQLSAPYQNQLQSGLFPYQQAQFGDSALQGLLGYGQGQTSTTPGPSSLSQLTGAATTGVSLLGGLNSAFNTNATNANGPSAAANGLGNIVSGIGSAASGLWNGISSLFANGGDVRGYADGGDVADDGTYAGIDGMSDDAFIDDGGGQPEAAQSTAGPETQDALARIARSADPAAPLPETAPMSAEADASHAPASTGTPTDAGTPNVGGGQVPQPAPQQMQQGDAGSRFMASPWMPLMQAGLGMMAGDSPFAGVNIGRGGLAGVQAMHQQQMDQPELAMRQAQLSQAQDQAALSRVQTPALINAYQHGLNIPQMPPGLIGSPQQGGGLAGAPVPPLASRIAMVENSGNTDSSNNPQGYRGKYQFGEPALMAAGVYKPAPNEDTSKNQWQGTFTIPGSPWKPMNAQQFFSNPQAQDAAFGLHTQNLDSEIQSRGLDQYYGKTVAGVPITHDNLIEAMHLAGPQGTQQWLQSGGQHNPSDALGSTIPSYISKVNGIGGDNSGGSSPAGGGVAGAQPSDGIDYRALQTGQYYSRIAEQKAMLHLPNSAETEQAAAAYKLAYAGATAAATKAAELPYTVNTLRGPGSVLTVGGKPTVQIPQEIHTVDSNGTPTTKFVQPIENAGGMPAPYQTALSPGNQELVKGAAEEYNTAGKKKYESATSSLVELNQLDSDIDNLNKGGGWSVTGDGNAGALSWAKTINSAFQRIGGTPPIDTSKVASWEQASKITKRLGLDQASLYGSREAASIMQMSVSATPGSEATPQGYKLLAGGVREMANREVDLRNFQTQWANQHGGNLLGSDVAFNQASPPQAYAQRNISQVRPVQVQSPADLKNLLPGTQFLTPDGRVKVVPGNQAVGAQ